MKIVSVNVGLPREIKWRGETVRTSIFKAPVSGPVRVARLNIDGDEQSDETKEVSKHQQREYDEEWMQSDPSSDELGGQEDHFHKVQESYQADGEDKFRNHGGSAERDNDG